MKLTLTTKCLAMFAGCFLAIGSSHAEEGMWASVGMAPSSRGGGTSLALGYAKENWGVELGMVSHSVLKDRKPELPAGHIVRHVGNYTEATGVDAAYQFPVGSFRPYVGIGAYFTESREEVYSITDSEYYSRSVDSSFSFARQLGLQMTAGGFLFGIGYHTLRGGNISIGGSF
jgi:hypothetical protein